MFSCEFCEISKNTFFIKHLGAIAFETRLHIVTNLIYSKHQWNMVVLK